MSLKKRQPVASWIDKLLKPRNCDVETDLKFVLGTCMRYQKHKLIYIVPTEDKNT